MESMAGKNVVITGGTGGIGYYSALGLAKTGARVLVTGRNNERGEAAAARLREASGNEAVFFVRGDLSSLRGVEELASALLEITEVVDVLVNNAGHLGNELSRSEDGLEQHFAVNVLAPWHLTMSLLPALRASGNGRVVNVTGGDKPAPIDPDNLQAEKGFRGLMTYTHSKSVMEAMSMMLAMELESSHVTLNVVFPGRASTAMTSSLSAAALPGPMKLLYPLFRWLFREDNGKSAAKAARSTVWCATNPSLDKVSGAYFDTNSLEKKLHPTAHDPSVHARIGAVLETAVTANRAGASAPGI